MIFPFADGVFCCGDMRPERPRGKTNEKTRRTESPGLAPIMLRTSPPLSTRASSMFRVGLVRTWREPPQLTKLCRMRTPKDALVPVALHPCAGPLPVFAATSHMGSSERETRRERRKFRGTQERVPPSVVTAARMTPGTRCAPDFRRTWCRGNRADRGGRHPQRPD